MTFTGLDVFDTTLHKTTAWLNELMEAMGWTSKHRAYEVLRAVLHAVRDRLMPDEAVHLGAGLPLLVRGFYYEGWHPAGKPLKYRHKDDFIGRIAKDCPGLAPEEIEKAAGIVFRMLDTHVGGGEIAQVHAALPAEVRALWRSRSDVTHGHP